MKPFVDKSLARGLASRSLREWTDATVRFEQDASHLMGRMRPGLSAVSSRSKATKRFINELDALLHRYDLPRMWTALSSRASRIDVCLPDLSNDKFRFVLGTGFINARSGATDLQRVCDIVSTRHALERLHQRIGTLVASDLVHEVFSCRLATPVMRAAASAAGACQWPLETTHGLFVCAPAEEDAFTEVVTWIRTDQLGRRWRNVLQDLHAEPGYASGSASAVADVLRRHAWLLRPHDPGTDLETLWWASRTDRERVEVAMAVEASASDDGNHSSASTSLR